MRLVHRDKGCAICLAIGIKKTYKYLEDSSCYEGAHIIGLAHREIVSCYPCVLRYLSLVIVKWDNKRFSELVADPFTDPANADSPLAGPSTRSKKDLRRINSLDNGILLCVEHHKDFDNFRFAIHYEVKTPFPP